MDQTVIFQHTFSCGINIMITLTYVSTGGPQWLCMSALAQALLVEGGELVAENNISEFAPMAEHYDISLNLQPNIANAAMNLVLTITPPTPAVQGQLLMTGTITPTNGTPIAVNQILGTLGGGPQSMQNFVPLRHPN